MNIDSDDYFWINVFLDEKVITMNRSSLNNWARRYRLTPGDYKNKRLLLLSMLDLWEGRTTLTATPNSKKITLNITVTLIELRPKSQ